MSEEEEKKNNISYCSICLDSLEDSQGDPGCMVVVCKVCHCTVHHRCWGQDKKFQLLREANPSKNEQPQFIKRFTCDSCKYNQGPDVSSEVNSSQECIVCRKKIQQVYLQRIRVAQSQQSHRKIGFQWAHTLCALTHDAFEVTDFKEMEITLNPQKILYPEENQGCSLCQQACGLVFPNRSGNQFAHLICIKFQMLEQIESNRDGKLVGWSTSFLNKPAKSQLQPEEQKEQSLSNLKMQTRTRSRKQHAQHLHEHVSWLRTNVTAHRGGEIDVLSEDERSPQTVCICGNSQMVPNDERFWVACDICAIWYHGECINKKQEEFDLQSVFVCKRCANWNKLKQDLISEVKPHYQVSKASLLLDLNATGNFLTPLLPTKILIEAEHLLMSEIVNSQKVSHSTVKLVDQILVAWVWQKRAVNLTRYCANLGLLLEHLRIALLLPLKINSTIYEALVQKVNLGISAAKEIEEVVLATPSEAGKCLPAQACDAVEKINNKLYNEIKLTLPTDFQPSLLTQASSVLLTLDRLRKPPKKIFTQRQGFCLSSQEELSRALKITKALTAFSIPDFQTRRASLFSTVESFFFEPVTLLFQCPAPVVALTQDFQFMQEKLESRTLFGPSSPEHQKIKLALKEYKTWLDNYQHIVSLILNPNSGKKKRANLVPLKATSGLKKYMRPGIGAVLLNQLQQDEEWLFYYKEESKSKLSMGDVQNLIDEANKSIAIDLSREIDRLRDMGNKFQQISQVAGGDSGPHSQAIAKLESKIKKRPKSHQSLNSIRDIAQHIILESSLVPVEVEDGFVRLFEELLTWKRNASKLLFPSNQNSEQEIPLINALYSINSEYLANIPDLLPETQLNKLKEHFSEFEKWANRYQYVLNECTNVEVITEYLHELNTRLKQSGVQNPTKEASLLQRKLSMLKDPKGFITSERGNMSLQEMMVEIQKFGLKEYYGEAGLLEQIEKAKGIQEKVNLILEDARQGIEPQQEQIQQILQINLPFQIDTKPVH